MSRFDDWYNAKMKEHKRCGTKMNRPHIVRPNMNKRRVVAIRKNVTKQEHDSADVLSIRSPLARRQIGSGCIDGMKGDSVSDIDMCECKQTSKDFIAIKISWLKKIVEESMGLCPFVHIRFVRGKQNGGDDINWWIAPVSFFNQLNLVPSRSVSIPGKSKVFNTSLFNDIDGDALPIIETIWSKMDKRGIWWILPQGFFVALLNQMEL